MSRGSTNHPVPRRSSRGYTLVEVLVSSTAMGLLTAGIASALLIATQSLDDTRSAPYQVHRATVAADEIARDLSCAKAFTTASFGSSPYVLEFTVADRDGDDGDEVIRYEWTGTSGDPLTRSVNGGAAISVLDYLHYAVLDFNKGDDESLLIYENSGGHSTEFDVEADDWVGQFFWPEFSDEVTSWSLTRVEFHARIQDHSGNTTRIQIRRAIGGLPSTNPDDVLAEVVVEGSEVGWDWYPPVDEVCFDDEDLKGLPPEQALCIVFKYEDTVSGDDTIGVHYQSSGAGTERTYMVKTTDYGATWSAPSGQSIWINVYGKVATSVQWTSLTIFPARDPNRVDAGSLWDISERVDVGVQMLNTPAEPPK